MKNTQLKTLENGSMVEKNRECCRDDDESGMDREDEESFDEVLNMMIKEEVPPFLITEDEKLRPEEEGLLHDSEPEENIQDKILTYNRKDKSLMELTRKFIEKFEGSTSTMLILDQITIEFNIERRRIYDIINIMESLNVVSKVKKNVYEWKGLRKAIETIEFHNSCYWNEDFEKNKREKSLESLATEFLKLFSQRKSPLTLEEAAKSILIDANDQVKKTKIRRLYDIVNVFKCLGFVEKVKGSKLGGKPVYEWQGYGCLLKIIQEKGQSVSEIEERMSILNSKSDFSNSKDDFEIVEENFKFAKISNFETCSFPSLKKFNSQTLDSTSNFCTDISNSENCMNRCNQIRKNSLNIESNSQKTLPELKKQKSFSDTVKYQKVSNHILKHPISEKNLIEEKNVNEEPSFFHGLFKHLNTSGTDSISDVYHKLTQIIWPSS